MLHAACVLQACSINQDGRPRLHIAATVHAGTVHMWYPSMCSSSKQASSMQHLVVAAPATACCRSYSMLIPMELQHKRTSLTGRAEKFRRMTVTALSLANLGCCATREGRISDRKYDLPVCKQHVSSSSSRALVRARSNFVAQWPAWHAGTLSVRPGATAGGTMLAW